MKKIFKILGFVIGMVVLLGVLDYNAFFGLFDYFNEQKYSEQELDREKMLVGEYLADKYPGRMFGLDVRQSFDRYWASTFIVGHIHYKWVIHINATDGDVSFEVRKTGQNEYADDYAKIYNIRHYGDEAKRIVDRYNNISLDETKLQAFSHLDEQGVIYDSGVFADADCFNDRLCDSVQDMADMYLSKSRMFVGFYFDKVDSIDISKIKSDIDYISSVVGESVRFKIGFTATISNSAGKFYCYDIFSDSSDEEIEHIMKCYEQGIALD